MSSPGPDLLIATAGGILTADQNERIASLVWKEADFSAAVEAALFHGTAPLLC
jgi:hypothetical protein